MPPPPDFTPSNLTGAKLISATLTDAKLIGANLTSAVLVGASLTQTDLTGTNLTAATVAAADLFNMLAYQDPTGAYPGQLRTTGLTQDQLHWTVADPSNRPKFGDLLDEKSGLPLEWRGMTLDGSPHPGYREGPK